MYQNVAYVDKPVSDALMTAGWVVMIPSQSIVLWSRLHLITRNERLLRFLLYMIIIDSLCLIIPTCVLNWGSLMGHLPRFIHGYGIIEKIQMCVFTTQEVIISGVYLFEVRNVMSIVFEKRAKGMMKQLILMNLLIIFLDLVTISIEFCNLFMIQVTMKSMIYSVKLKVEFAVLSKVISVVRESRNNSDRVVAVVAQPVWNPDMKVDPEKAISPRTSAVRTARTNSSDRMQALRFQSMDSARLYSLDTIGVLPSVKYPEAAAQASTEDEGRYVRSLQQNVPAEWRLSIGHEALSGPNLFEIKQLSYPGNEDDGSVESAKELYPGRLDAKETQVSGNADEDDDSIDSVDELYPGRLYSRRPSQFDKIP